MAGEKLSLNPRRVMQAVDSFLFLWLSRILGAVLAALVFPLARLSKPGTPVPRKGPHLMIAAGIKGWELIEYQEIFASASEYLGSTNVARLAFSRNRPMLEEFRDALRKVRPSHYYFDPRSGSQTPLKAAWETLVVGFLLERYRVTPICHLTDFAVRRWRLQVAAVSARSGVVTSLMSPVVIGGLFPHKRIVGPMPFPLSVATLQRLRELKQRNTPKWRLLQDKAVFVGMLHEPRKAVVEAIQQGLANRGIPMEIIGRMPDGARISDDDYWEILVNARLVISTSSQMVANGGELIDHNHFIYRFIEATAAGTALAIDPVWGAEDLLQPGLDFIAFTSPAEAVEKISSAWHQPGALEKISRRGAARSKDLIESHHYWTLVFD
jgi:hypothetical protein